MITSIGKIVPILAVFLALFFIESGVTVEYADARSRGGGRMFSRPVQKAPTQQNMNRTNQTTQQNKSGFGRGLAGGLIGGALGAMLFGSLLGASGEGFGLLPILLLAGVGFFLYRRFSARSRAAGNAGGGSSAGNIFNMQGDQQSRQSSQEDNFSYLTPVEQGIQEIQQADRDFDRNHFIEVASDVFFQVQAGWMRRDLESYRHLLGEKLAEEYAGHFEEMRQAGHINKLESIAIRRVEIVNAGSDGQEDFVTVLFTANLLDYTVEESSGDLVEGSMTTPVKFAEEWTWARPTGTQNWLLEGVKVASE
ncbi:Tim44 domain-containing protein [Desulfopila inferna]|uniref:Tim44 domain-containing protein n=1 Tax=Desulfopila inferna TaxID=468528 RepID=UPI001962D515|nr:Tim44 domain-containing protein [Desulfopila inferna]MBM9606162.1 Tim44 domain-containing protein [Desulfopila inferna]